MFLSHNQFVVFIKYILSAGQQKGHKLTRTKQLDREKGKEAQNNMICTLISGERKYRPIRMPHTVTWWNYINHPYAHMQEHVLLSAWLL